MSAVVVPHRGRPAAVELARKAVAWLEAHGHRAAVPDEAAHGTVLEDWAKAITDVGDVDLAVSLGGDGTMLRTVDLVCGLGIPVLGVNVGHLGYLTEIDPDGLEDSLRRFYAGEHSIEARMTLEVTIRQNGDERRRLALNEAVVEKTLPGHTVRFGVTIDGEFFTTYAADGIIVATPTGSTAYNLSARGPIVSPRLRALLMTPVSPHMLFDRSLILDPVEEVRLEVIGEQPAAAVVDGQTQGTLAPGDVVVCRAGERDAKLVTFGGRDFHRILKAKFGLADR